WITTSGEKMSKSLGNSLLVPNVLEQVRGIELRYYMVAAHYRSHVEFSFEALAEAAAGFQRIEGFLERVGGAPTPQMLDRDVENARANVPSQHVWGSADLPAAYVTAMNDDHGTPAAVGVIHDVVRAGNKALAEGDHEAASRQAVEVRAMLGVLGLDPADEHWSTGGTNDLTPVVDALVKGLLDQRAEARATKDFATADAIRDQIKAAGVTIEDTPSGPKWSV
ncbi:MAG: DALR domain-containing protein, partial [Marmoricola sp.]